MRRGFGTIFKKRRRDKDGRVVESRHYYIRYTDPLTKVRVDVPMPESAATAREFVAPRGWRNRPTRQPPAPRAILDAGCRVAATVVRGSDAGPAHLV